MNRIPPEALDGLAAEYVLGSLTPATRARYQYWLMIDPNARRALWYWESKLNSLGESLQEVQPDAAVWQNLCVALGFPQAPPEKKIGPPKVAHFPGTPKSPPQGGWRGATALATAAALLFAILLFTPKTPIPIDQQSQIAVVQSEGEKALWLISLTDTTLKLQATEGVAQRTDRDYELWLIAAEGGAPVSLGLLPQKGEALIMRHQLFDTVTVAALAVSLEPPGGSPDGSPTEVLYTAELVAM